MFSLLESGWMLKLDFQGQGGGRKLAVNKQGGWKDLKIGQFSWASYVYHPLLLLLYNSKFV